MDKEDCKFCEGKGWRWTRRCTEDEGDVSGQWSGWYSRPSSPHPYDNIKRKCVCGTPTTEPNVYD